MKLQLGLRNVLHRKFRTLVSIIAVAFIAVPSFVQLGLYDAMMRSATLFYDTLEFDVAIVSANYSFFSKPGAFPRDRLYQAGALPEVTSARPFYVGFLLWRNIETRFEREILIMAFDPRSPPFLSPEIRGAAASLREPDTVLFDALSRPEYGPHEPGMSTELQGRRVRIVDSYRLGPGFAALGAAMTGDETLARLSGRSPAEAVSVGLITLRPGASPEQAVSRLRSMLPADVRILTRDELRQNEESYWARTTSLGVILAFGLAIALIVGTIILYQILFTDINHRLAEFATLQAIGYRPIYVSFVVLQQAAVLTLGGFIPGVLISILTYHLTVRATNLPMLMTPGRVVLVFLFTVAIGCIAGLLAIRKARLADPADLFG